MPGVSLSILGTMVLLVGAACGVFWMLTRRWVHSRQMGALYDWARANGMQIDRHGESTLPDVLLPLSEQPELALGLHGEDTVIVQLRTQPTGGQLHPRLWNVFLRRLPIRWPATALRIADAESQFMDFFSLPAIAGMAGSDRFTVHGEDRSAAARLAASPLGAMLPPGIGLLLMGDYLLLDFSSRPFDGTEFTRLGAVADQVIAHLPG